ncbi:Putative HLH-domain-containing protein [Rhizopus microsporus]|nr:Putative HLH-domain-containing protein [Rhizopus microsporus]
MYSTIDRNSNNNSNNNGNNSTVKLPYNTMPSISDRIYNNKYQPVYQQPPSSNNRETTDVSSPNSMEDEMMQKKSMQEIFEKKRRRRESHNAVERRRRENINERINELATLLPDSREAIKSNKGTILRKSVDHIRYLHDKLRQHQQRIQELESALELYRVRLGQQMMPPPGHPLDLSAIQPHYHHPPLPPPSNTKDM